MLDASAIILGTQEITVEEAMQIPAYSASIEFICGTVAGLPVRLYEEDGTQTREITNDERTQLLNGYTGDLIGTGDMFRGMIRDYFNHGAGYAYVERKYNGVRALHYVRAEDVSVTVREDKIRHDADIWVQGDAYKPFEFLRICRNTINGVDGTGIPEQSQTQLAAAYAALKYELTMMRSGGKKRGVLRSEKRLDEETMAHLRERWRRMYDGDDERVVVLNNGVEFKELSTSSVDLQINQNKVTNSEEIARMFLLSPEVIAGGATAEQLVSAVRVAVMPIIEQLQAAMNDTLLTQAERKKRYFAFDTAEMMRGDVLKRYQAYKIALDANFMQPDEVRYREDLAPLGMNFVKLGLNDVLYDPKTGSIYTPNTNETANINGKEKSADESGAEK